MKKAKPFSAKEFLHPLIRELRSRTFDPAFGQ